MVTISPQNSSHPNVLLTPVHPQGVFMANSAVEAKPDILEKKEWHESVDDQFELSKQTGELFTVILIDIDTFKAVNDELGHPVGDTVIADTKQVLTTMATNILLESLRIQEGRSSDLIAKSNAAAVRSTANAIDSDMAIEDLDDIDAWKLIDPQAGHIGGDEFAVMCKTDEAGGIVIVDRVRRAFDEYLNQPENHQLRELGVGMSMGLSVFKPEMESSSEMKKEADEAMYEDKIANFIKNQLDRLSSEQLEAAIGSMALLRASGIRPRDVPKLSIALNSPQFLNRPGQTPAD